MDASRRGEFDTRCPLCDADSKVLAHAVVAPWIDELEGDSSPMSELCLCGTCDFRFFSYRYREKLVDAIYGGYRDERFFTVRHSWEPWYSRGVNNAFKDATGSTQELAKRRSFTEGVLERVGMNLRRFKGALDYGGDMGQFFPQNVDPPLYLLDVAQRSSTANLLVVSHLNQVAEKVDLVLNCYVLEHISDPVLCLQDMQGVVASDGVIYIEVPLDSFKTHPWHASPSYVRYLHFLRRHKILFVTADFISGLFRQLGKAIPRFGVVKQSEHINYFSATALRRLAESKACDVVWISEADEEYSVGHIRQGRLAMVLAHRDQNGSYV